MRRAIQAQRGVAQARTRAQKDPAPRGWRFRRKAGVETLQADAFGRESWLVHGFSTRCGGTSELGSETVLNLGLTEWDTKEAVAKNRAALLASIGADGMQLISLRQIHSDAVHRVDGVPHDALTGDALISATPGLALGVQTADCVPILLADRRTRAIAAVHAGWRGTLARIVAKTIGRMRMEFGTRAADLIAAIGPCIAQCSYEVGAEVAQEFAAQFPEARAWFDGPFEKVISNDSPNPLKWLSMMPPGHDPPPPTVQLDLIAANRWQLVDAGVTEKNISSAGLCTACRTDLFFSYRRERGKTGRMMAVIGMREGRMANR